MSSYVRPTSLPCGTDSVGNNESSALDSDAGILVPSLASIMPTASVELLFSLFVSLAAVVHTPIEIQRSNIIENIVNQDIGFLNIHTKYIGSGSTFNVRELRDDFSGQSLAFKSAMPLDSRLTEPEERRRLTSIILELRALTFLHDSDSRNVVRLLAVGWETDLFDSRKKWPVPVLELGDGGTMDDFLRARNESFDSKIRFCLDVTTGLETLHRHGIIHGDLKPANLLVLRSDDAGSERGWIVKLTDFGGAVLDVQDYESATLRTPTPPWNAPEWTDRLSARSILSTDVYSLGLVCVSILCDCSNFFESILLMIDAQSVPSDRDSQLNAIQNLKLSDQTFRSKLLDAISIRNKVSNGEIDLIKQLLSSTVRVNSNDRSLPQFIQILRRHNGVAGVAADPHSNRRAATLTATLQNAVAGPSELELLTPEVQKYVRERLEQTASQGLDSVLRSTAALTLAIDALDAIEEDGGASKGHSCLAWLICAAELGDKLAQSLVYRFHTAFGEPVPCRLEGQIRDWLLESALRGYGPAQEDLIEIATEDEICSFKKTYRTIYGGIGADRFAAQRPALGHALRVLDDGPLLDVPLQDQQLAIENSSVSKDTLLHAAASTGDIALVAHLLHLQPTVVDVKAAHGETPLLLACRSGHADVVNFLLEQGADPSIADENGDGPLHWIISFEESGMQKITEKLCRYGAELNLWASRWKPVADSEAAFEPGTPLHRAVQRGSLAATKALLEHGANPDTSGGRSDGWTPMHLAAHFHTPDILRALLQAIPGTLPARKVFGHSSLLIPTIKGQIDRGRIFNKIARHGRQWSARQRECLKLLLHLGADAHLHQMPSESIGNGATALFIAIGLTHPNAAQFLLENGAQSDVETLCALEEGHTPSSPLHRSIVNWNKSSFLLLLQHGADPLAKYLDQNELKQTYVYECASSGHADIFMASQLLDRGVEVDEAPPGYETPFACAVRRRCFNLASCLLTRGANLCPEFSAGFMFENNRPLFLHSVLIMEQSISTLSCLDFLFEQEVKDRNVFLYTSSTHDETVFHQIAKTPEEGRDDIACRLIATRLLEWLDPSSQQINALTSGGYSALALAANTGNMVVAALLVEHGANPLAGTSELQSASALLQVRIRSSQTSRDMMEGEMLRLFKSIVPEDEWIDFHLFD